MPFLAHGNRVKKIVLHQHLGHSFKKEFYYFYVLINHIDVHLIGECMSDGPGPEFKIK